MSLHQERKREFKLWQLHPRKLRGRQEDWASQAQYLRQLRMAKRVRIIYRFPLNLLKVCKGRVILAKCYEQ
jgi:hypothetical protein